MLKYILKFYRYFNLLSLDVAIGAALLSAAISNYLNGNTQWGFATCLGIAVWIIYTFDHLIDAYKSPDKPSINRHLFHKTHAKKLILLIIMASIWGWLLVLKLPQVIVFWGFILLGLVSFYFALIIWFKKFYLKEVFVAVVYTSGVFLGPVSIYLLPIDMQIVSFFIQLLFIAFANLCLFSMVEYELDIKDNHPSLTRRIGIIKVKRLIKMVLIFTIAIQIISFIAFGFNIFQLLFLIMTITLSLVYMYAHELLRNESYRWIADAVFFTPALLLLY